MRFRSPRWRPTPEAAGEPDPATVPGPSDAVDPATTATAARPSPRRARLRPRPLPSPRPDLDTDEAPSDADADLEDDEYWDDEYDDDLEYDDDAEYDDDEYWDDEYEDDYLDDDEYDEDEFEDEYDDLEDDEADAADGRRRRLLGRGRKGRARRRGRLGRRARPEAGIPADSALSEDGAAAGEPVRPRPRPAPLPVGADGEGATGLALPGVEPADDGEFEDGEFEDDEFEDDAAPARRRRLPRVPVATMRASTARGWASTRSGLRHGWSGTRRGVAAAIHFLRTHWGRAAYIYLGFVGAGLLITVLLYWHSGFTYDECNYCGMPVLMTVSPWWLLILPFNVSQWPLLLPLFVILLFAGLNAELFDRWSKRPEPEYPDWD